MNPLDYLSDFDPDPNSGFWHCESCGEQNSMKDSECQFCDGAPAEPEEEPELDFEHRSEH